MRNITGRTWPAVATLLAVGAASLGGCAPTSADDGRLQVLASFYPLQYVAQEVGGTAVQVSSLTPPGAEPHDVELSPRQVRSVGDADVVVYLSGFQPAVDDAVQQRRPAHPVDAATAPGVAERLAAGHTQTSGQPADGAEGGRDPHFWLDPTLLVPVADEVAAALAEADPAHAADYVARAAALRGQLLALDAELRQGLATCERRVVVTSHAAFGYLADRYGLEQVGLSGLDPEAEPSPARLREIRAAVAGSGVTTIFTESLVNPKVSRTLADDLGLRTAVLDPVESQVDPHADYRAAMEQNLAALRTSLGCS
ncbi:MAG TPA: metal ABC transporter substrate-binding protein [Actinotalea sp.]